MIPELEDVLIDAGYNVDDVDKISYQYDKFGIEAAVYSINNKKTDELRANIWVWLEESGELPSKKCDKCNHGSLRRHHVCEDYVVWECDTPDCTNQDLEQLYELKDEGWSWLRNYCENNGKDIYEKVHDATV